MRTALDSIQSQFAGSSLRIGFGDVLLKIRDSVSIGIRCGIRGIGWVQPVRILPVIGQAVAVRIGEDGQRCIDSPERGQGARWGAVKVSSDSPSFQNCCSTTWPVCSLARALRNPLGK